jgi:hypothetical protein
MAEVHRKQLDQRQQRGSDGAPADGGREARQARGDDALGDEVRDGMSSQRRRTAHEPAGIADDRGLGADRSRISFSGEREADELGSETEGEGQPRLDYDDDLTDAGGYNNR